jgi:hypothetical protein
MDEDELFQDGDDIQLEDFSDLKLAPEVDEEGNRLMLPIWVVPSQNIDAEEEQAGRKKKVKNKDKEVIARVYLEVPGDHSDKQAVENYKLAVEFLGTIAEPISRPRFIHLYHVTSYTLYAGVSLGFEPQRILNAFESMSKLQLTEQFKATILYFAQPSTLHARVCFMSNRMRE